MLPLPDRQITSIFTLVEPNSAFPVRIVDTVSLSADPHSNRALPLGCSVQSFFESKNLPHYAGADEATGLKTIATFLRS